MLATCESAEEVNAKILVVDDDPTNLFVLSEFLSEQGFWVLRAQNGHEAIEIADAESPTVILMDLSMPGMDGFEAAEAILGHAPESQHPVIIAVSANVTKAHQERCRAVGFTDFYGKPLDFETIVDNLHTHLRNP